MLLALTLFVSLGVFLFGYDQGVMSGIITNRNFKDYFNYPTASEIGWTVAILEIGALVSSLAAGPLSDKLGRRKSIFYGALVFCFGSLVQVMAPGIRWLMAGRAIAGLGIGLLSSVVPVYQSEISKASNRGKLACIEYSGNILGYACSVWIDLGCSYFESDSSWVVPISVQLAMGLVLLLGSLVIPETPRWLANNGLVDEAQQVATKLYKEPPPNLFENQQQLNYKQMWKKYKFRVLIAMSAQMFAQLNGINVISYYAPLVFEQAGFEGRKAVLMTGVNAIFYLVASVWPWFTIDNWGRRRMLIYGGLVMCFFLTAMSGAIWAKNAGLTVVFVIAYNFAFGCSWGPVPWLYPPEIMPLSIRARGAALSTASNWFFNFIVGVLVPNLQQTMKWRLYLVPAFFSFLSVFVVKRFYPETKGVRLEDMDKVFSQFYKPSGSGSRQRMLAEP